MFESTTTTTTSKKNLFGPSVDTDFPGWLEFRRQGVTATDIAKVMGLSNYGDATDVYIDKVSTTEEVHSPKTLQLFKRGTKMESLVAEEYTEVTGRKVRRQPPRMLSLERSHLRCSVDRQELADDSNPTGMLECKTAGQQMFRKIAMEGLPADYIMQVQHNLGIWNYKSGAIAILCPDTFDFLHFRIQRDDLLVEQGFEAATKFWQNVQDQVVPEVNRKAVKLPKVGGIVTQLDSVDFREAVASLNVATQLASEAAELKGSAQEVIKAMMTDNGHDVVEGFGNRIYFKEQAGRKTFDKKALKAAHPEIDLALFEKQGDPFRSFRSFDVSKEVA